MNTVVLLNTALSAPYPPSEKVQASLDKTCPKCGFTITPDLVRRVDFERMERPKCGERFQP